jgi:hypothetical protein
MYLWSRVYFSSVDTISIPLDAQILSARPLPVAEVGDRARMN